MCFSNFLSSFRVPQITLTCNNRKMSPGECECNTMLITRDGRSVLEITPARSILDEFLLSGLELSFLNCVNYRRTMCWVQSVSACSVLSGRPRRAHALHYWLGKRDRVAGPVGSGRACVPRSNGTRRTGVEMLQTGSAVSFQTLVLPLKWKKIHRRTFQLFWGCGPDGWERTGPEQDQRWTPFIISFILLQ